jgi:hypothetical protein
MLGFAAIAAIAAMAFVGVSSAMASEEIVLCKEDKDPCPAAKDFPAGTVLDASLVAGTTANLVSNLGTVKCSESTTTGSTSTLSGNPLDGDITGLTFNSCKLGETKCTATAEHLNYLVLLKLTGALTYHVVVEKKGTNGNPQAFVECGSLIKCSFGAPEVLLKVELLANDVDLSVNQALERITGPGFICGNTSTWEAKYLVQCLEGAVKVGCWPAMKE